MFGKVKTSEQQPFERYVDPTGELPNQELKYAGWWLHHKLAIEHIGIGVLLAFCIGTVGYSVVMWGLYFANGYFSDQTTAIELRRSFVDYTVLHQMTGAKDLIVTDTVLLRSAPGKYDAAVTVKNPNERYLATVTYHFVVDGSSSETRMDTLLPGEQRPVVSFGLSFDQEPFEARFIIDHVAWQRINPHVVPDVASFIATRRDVKAENVTYASQQSDGGLLTFDLVNGSAYSYWQPVLYVVLLNNGQTSGIVYVSVDQLRAMERRSLSVRVLTPNIPVSDVVVYPVLNVFSLDAYMMPGTP